MAEDVCITSPIDTPLGTMIAAVHAGRICLLEYTTPGRLEPQLARVRQRFRCDVIAGEHATLDRLRHELAAYFAGSLVTFTTPFVVAGTQFQERVWTELLRIPYGETRSYEEVAHAAGAAGAQRAVGHANGSNRIAIVIPCHRVINKSGRLGGYGGELWRKEALLALESAAARQTSLFT
jgi:AraC family transcriptional regulator of adaptative response/methylated-DNA-[protein]-cysteine methyltransferase